MSRGKKIALGILTAIVAAVITWYFVTRNRYLTVYADELIDNVFDEIYYSEMHPLLFRYTPTTVLNLRGVVEPNDRFYEDWYWGVSYSTRGPCETEYWIRVSNIPHMQRVLMEISVFKDDYGMGYIYEYSMTDKKVYFKFGAYRLNDYGYMTKGIYDIEEFLEEKSLSYEDFRKEQELKFNEFLGYWFDMNNGLSRFSLDDLGDLTIEYAY